MSITRRDSPRALRTGQLPDPFTRSLYSFAPYRGCAHGCRYCDGRAEKYYVEGDFERDIEARVNIHELLAAELPKLRDRGMISIGSGTTDAYQPCERTEAITARTIPLLVDRGWPVSMMTKSSLAIRDLDAWSGVIGRGGLVMHLSIVSTDESVRERFEPGASSFGERLETLTAFREAGAVTGALAMPLLPGITDDEASLRRLFGALKETGVSFIMPGGLTLRPGRQKECYLETLSESRLDLRPLYDRIYAENRPSGSPLKSASEELFRKAGTVLKEFDLPWTLPHREFRNLLPPYDALRVLFRDMVELYRGKGVPTRSLVSAADRYDAWLLEIRRHFRRRRSLPESWLEERFMNAVELGELDRTLDNAKLAAFSRGVVLQERVFDYRTLKLVDG